MMTKFRWNDPPKEHDPARYDQDHDPALRFLGRKDGSTITDRQKILNRLIEIEDSLRIFDPEENDELIECQNVSDFDPSISIPDRITTDGVALVEKIVSNLKKERLELKERLASFPRTDRF